MSSVFYWASGQDDNIGDVVLRRRLLDSLHSSARVHIHVGGASQEFIEALDVGEHDAVYTNFFKFVWAASRQAIVGNLTFFFDPGEVNSTLRAAAMHGLLLPALVIARLRGSRKIVRVGVGIGKRHKIWSLPIRWSAALCTENTWRDDESSRYIGRGSTAPDLAFGYGTHVDLPGPRTLLVISMRGDAEAPSDSFVGAISRYAQAKSLTPMVVVQVRRDSAAMAKLAERLACAILAWPEHVSHKEQESRLRDVYRRSSIVQSDRLHCLILGVSEGAYPMALMQHTDKKIGRSFRAAGYRNVSVDVSDMSHDEMFEVASEIADGRFSTLNARSQKSAFDLVSQDMCRIQKRYL